MRRLVRVLGLGIVVLLMSTQSVGAASPILYGVDSSTDQLRTIDFVTGTSTFIGRLDPGGVVGQPNTQPNRFATPVAMTVRQSDNTIFVWNNSACLVNPGDPCKDAIIQKLELVTVDPTTGEATAVSPQPQVSLQAIAYDPVSDTLYGVGGPLYIIDTNTGVVSTGATIKDSGGNSVRFSGAAFDTCGTLFGLELVNTTAGVARLFTIDTTSGSATLVGGIANPGLTGSIAFAPDGTLVGNATAIGALFDIDPVTAAVSNARGNGLVQGLGFVTDSPGVCEGGIDIKPHSDPNSINTNSKGTIPVAILSTPDFDAPSEVDKSSLTFGITGDEDSLAKCTKSSEDVNGDGLQDVVCHFKTQDTGFEKGDTEGILKGTTLGGVPFEGRDAVRIVR